MTTHDDGHVPDLVRDIVEPIAAELGVEVLDVQLTGPHGRRLIRVVADVIAPLPAVLHDEPAPGVDVDAIAVLSRKLGGLLDDRDVFPGSYTLEVSSPGVTAPLTRAQDFARNLGREVRVIRRGDDAATDGVQGTVTAVADDRVTLGTEDGDIEVLFEDIDQGTVVLPW